MTIERISQWFFILTLVISALISSTLNPLVFHLISSFILIGSTILIVTNSRNLKISTADILVFLTLISPVLSISTTINHYHTGLFIIFSMTMLFYFLAARSFLKKRTLLAVIIALPIVFSLFSFWQYTGGLKQTESLLLSQNLSPSVETALINRLTKKRVFATFALPNSFAGYLIIVILLLMGFYPSQSRDIQKLIIFSLLLVVINLLLTRSFGALLSLAVIIMMLFIFKRDQIIKNRLLALILAVTIILAASEGFRRYGSGAVFKPADSIYLRSLNFRAAKEIFFDNWLTGTGAGTFGDIYLMYQLPRSNIVKFTHNLPLQIASEQGIIGLSFFIIFWIYYFTKGKSMLKAGHLYLYLGGIVFFLHNLVDIDYNILSIALLFWSIMAVLFDEIETFTWQVPHIYVVTAVLLTVIPLLFFNSRWYYAEKSFIKAREIGREKEDLLIKAIKLNPYNANYFASLGRYNQSKFRRGEKKNREFIKQAVINFEKACNLAPTNAFYYSKLAVAQAINRDKEGALRAIQKARDFHPQNPDYKKMLKRIKNIP